MKKFKKVVLPIALSASVIGLAGCSTSGGDTYISSKVGNVTEKEVLENIGSQNVAKSATDVAVRKILLEKYKDKIDSKYIESQYEELVNQSGGKDAFEAILKQQGYTAEKIKEQLKVRTAQAYMLTEFSNITEDKIKEAYEKEKVQYHLAHILISVKSDTAPNGLSDEEAKSKAEDILKKLNEGGDFSTLAKENSTDTSNASNGGDLGWSSKESSSFVKEFSDAAYSLEKGKISGVVKTSFGYHIIKLLDTKELSYEEMKPQLVEKLAQNAVSADTTLYSKALKALFEEYDVKGNTDDVKNYITDMISGSTTTNQ